MLRKFTPYFDK